MPAVALAMTVYVETPANRINPAVRTRCTLTATAGVARDERVTPDTVAGKLTTTVSVLVPNPLY
jgi:hypothetical protein